MTLLQQASEEAAELLKTHVMGRSREDFDGLYPLQRYFINMMGRRYERHLEEGRPFFCASRQLKALIKIVERLPEREITR